jgi:hypothetical protein
VSFLQFRLLEEGKFEDLGNLVGGWRKGCFKPKDMVGEKYKRIPLLGLDIARLHQ